MISTPRAFFFAKISKRLILIWDDNTTVTAPNRDFQKSQTGLGITGHSGNRLTGKGWILASARGYLVKHFVR